MTSVSRDVAGATPPAVQPGRVLGVTRAGVWVLFVLAAANGLFLYFVPGRADTDYAWSIKPAVNAAFIGGASWPARSLPASCLARDALALVLAASAGAVGARHYLLAATIIHQDRFKWHYALTWVWALVYAGVPLAIPFLVARQQRVAQALPAADPALRVLRALSGITGAGLIAGAAALYLAPDELGQHWPWPLTPLLARAVAAWYALFGTMLLTFALEQRRRVEGLIGYATLAAWCVLLLALPLLHAEEVSGGWAWYTLMVALLALALYGLTVGWPERDRL